MTRTPQQPRAKATRDAIVEAGFLCVASSGMEAVTVRQIIDKAGVSPGSFYEYFENKGKVYEAMLERLVADAMNMIEPLTPALVQMSMQDLARTLLLNLDTFVRKDDELYLKCMRGARFDVRDMLEPAARMLETIVVRHAFHHPQTRRIRDLQAMVYILVNGGLALLLRYFTDPNPPLSYERFSEGLANMVGHFVAQENLIVAAAPPPGG